MPTPSHEDGAPSPPGHSFSSCPEDIPQIATPRALQPNSDEDDVEVTALDGPTSSHSSGEATQESLTRDRHSSAEPSTSSRATTVSPGPQSTLANDTTYITSPETVSTDYDMDKERHHNQDRVADGPLRGESSITSHEDEGRRRALSLRQEADPTDFGIEDVEPPVPCFGPNFSSMRTNPVSPSSYLRPGSRYHGTQQSERQVYDVQVEIKHVDMRESFLCGYLRIQGLTEDHPHLTTYFEGEIIGPKYHFFTQHDDWGASTKVDLSHWAKFPAFRPYQKHARKGPVTVADVAQREFIFMRWKEHFLVPDHRVRTISGASFEGFYYICFNQVKGEVSGIYFHSKSERFQQLELKHIPDRGCFSSVEFR